MQTYTIRPILTGYTRTNKATYIYHHSTHRFFNVEGFLDLPVTCFLVMDDSKLILIDTGMSDTEIAGKHHPGSYQPEGYAIHEQLAKLGVNPADIDLVILTHLHWDHVYHLAKFSRAKFFVQRNEYTFALNPIPLYYKSYEHQALGLKPQFAEVPFELLVGETEIIDGISVYPSPGHSVGHQTVTVNTVAGVYHCCGDAIFTYDNLTPLPEIHYSITPPARFQDVVNSWKSIEELKKRAQATQFILPTHELSMEALSLEGCILGKKKSMP